MISRVKEKETAKKIASTMTKLSQERDKGQLSDGRSQFAHPRLVLVGTVHRDPRGYTRLFRLLERECPAMVTVEISPYSRALRVQQSVMLLRTLRRNLRQIQKEDRRPLTAILSHSLIMGIFFLLKEPFEWRAAKIYASQNGIPLQDIDLSAFAQDHLANLPELIALENLQILLRQSSLSYPDLVRSQYSRAAFLLRHPPSIRITPPAFQEREAYMACRIREFAQGIKGGKILHVSGWEHLIDYPGGNSLFGLLKDLQPQRILLSASGQPHGLTGDCPQKLWKRCGKLQEWNSECNRISGFFKECLIMKQ